MKLFISYSHQNEPWVKDFIDALRNKTQHHVWYDRDLEGGSNWRQRILHEIEACDSLIFILTPDSVVSSHCQEEVTHAIKHNKSILPLILKPCNYPDLLAARNIQYLDVSNSPFELLLRIEKSLSFLEQENTRVKAIDLPNLQHTSWRDIPIMQIAVNQEDLVCVSEDTKLTDAYYILDISNFQFRHLLVTISGLAGSKLLGIVSLRTMLKKMYGTYNYRDKAQTVGDEDVIIRFPTESEFEPTIVSIRNNETLGTAIQKFLKPITRNPGAGRFYYMSAIPIIDEDEKAVGIVSFKDILKAMVRGLIPIPDGIIKQHMHLVDLDNSKSGVIVSNPEDTPQDARWKLGMSGQRDVPVIADETSTLLGLVPDHLLLLNLVTGKKLGEIMVPPKNLKLQEESTTLSDMLLEYIPSNIATTYYSLMVVSDKDLDLPNLVGVISYRDIFQGLIDS